MHFSPPYSILLLQVRRPGEKMNSLHDVFTAICADEGDHVSAMAACLDTEANLRSPSIERKILTGIAAFAVASFILSSSGILDASLLDSASDVVSDAAISATGDFSLVELAAAAMAGIAQMFSQDEEVRDLTDLGAEMAEGGVAEAAASELGRFGVKVAEFLTRFL